jgi:hypothetical protein
MRSLKREVVIKDPDVCLGWPVATCSIGFFATARPLWILALSEQFYTDAWRLIVEPYRCRALSAPPLSARGPRPESISKLVMYAYA